MPGLTRSWASGFTAKSNGSSTPCATSPNASCVLSREFPYSVVYLEQLDCVWIVAVMHAKRKPGYWRERL
jgi:tRNA (Thr-GGU) A37 N-methylase